MIPDWFYLVCAFAFGSCIGSFLNVVIYRLPRDKSLAFPPSMCPGCENPIRFYDNIPILSWLLLRGRCRNCKMLITSRYMVVELMTGLLFVAVFILYFIYGENRFVLSDVVGTEAFLAGGWVFYLIHIVLICCLVAASAIDLELWVIPLSLCWFCTIVGLIGTAICRSIIGAGAPDPTIIGFYENFPMVGKATITSLSAGAGIGLIIAMVLLMTGVIKRSYEDQGLEDIEEQINDKDYPHRLEVMKEIVFLIPIIVCSIGWYWACKSLPTLTDKWAAWSEIPLVYGFLASLWGYFIGCAVVWATRILGTLAFGKEAMGLGDVHLMGAAGAIIGPVFVTIAFFIAPFFGLAWAIYQMFFKKTRQIPYGPFLSMAVFAVMIFHDFFRVYINNLFMSNV
jgi:leader peptidase (prepilin peptidase)/N-methyltransferase